MTNRGEKVEREELSRCSSQSFLGSEEHIWIAGKFFFIAVTFLLVVFFSPEAKAEKKIGVLMFSEETRYNEATRGIMDKMKEEGFGVPHSKFIVENAGGNKGKAAELVKKFATKKMDLIFTLGTSATIAVAREIKDVPIVFGAVYDPVKAGIAKDWKSSGNNTTGVSTKVPMSKLTDVLRQFKSVKRMAVLYSPGEKNSEAQLKDLQEIQSDHKIKVVPVPLSKKEDIALILPDVIRTTDALYITGSNLVNSQLSFIVDIATKAKVLTITHLEDVVEKGALLGVCSDNYANGRLAGEKAIKIFNGAKPSSIPIEPIKEYNLLINMKTSREGAFQIPEKVMRAVKRTIQ